LRRTAEAPTNQNFEIKDLFRDVWNVEITGSQRNAFGKMFQKALNDDVIRREFQHLAILGVRENGDNHELYRRNV
tara:strand:- start:200169 stop:200393 length:225 start_codon:yes stop_codon:yes gene_type:complete